MYIIKKNVYFMSGKADFNFISWLGNSWDIHTFTSWAGIKVIFTPKNLISSICHLKFGQFLEIRYWKGLIHRIPLVEQGNKCRKYSVQSLITYCYTIFVEFGIQNLLFLLQASSTEAAEWMHPTEWRVPETVPENQRKTQRESKWETVWIQVTDFTHLCLVSCW